MLLVPEVTLFVHPVDTAKHPDCQPGSWRWAVHVGGGGPLDLERCVNARVVPTREEAMHVGDLVAAGACVGLRIFGIQASYTAQVLLTDPIPAGDFPMRMLRSG